MSEYAQTYNKMVEFVEDGTKRQTNLRFGARKIDMAHLIQSFMFSGQKLYSKWNSSATVTWDDLCENISESFKNLDDAEFYDAIDAILALHSLVNCIRSDLLNFECTHQAEKIESKHLISNSLVSPDEENLSALTAGW